MRRSLRDYLAKCDRTEGRPQAYGLMCRDGWMLDPTNSDGVLNVGDDDDDDGDGDGGGARITDENIGRSESVTDDGIHETLVDDFGVYTGGTSTPMLSLRDVLHGPGITTTINDSGGGRSLQPAHRRVVKNTWRSDATLALANEPDTLTSSAAGDRDRASRANIGVMELRTGTHVVFTLRDVPAGEELLWDYSEDYDRTHYFNERDRERARE